MVIGRASSGAIGSAFGDVNSVAIGRHSGVQTRAPIGVRREVQPGAQTSAQRRPLILHRKVAKHRATVGLRVAQFACTQARITGAISVCILKCEGRCISDVIERTKGGSAVHKTGVRWTAYSGEAGLKTGVLDSRISEGFLDSLVDQGAAVASRLGDLANALAFGVKAA